MKKPLVIWITAVIGIILLLLIANGCQLSATTSLASDPFTVIWGGGTDHVVIFSGDSAGHKAGEQSEFILKLKNKAGETWKGEYLVQLVDRDSMVQEIDRSDFAVTRGVEEAFKIHVVWNSELEGPYGLSLYIPVREAQAITTIWVGEKVGEIAGPWPSLDTHPGLWPDYTNVGEDAARQAAEKYIMNSPTFVFDGMEDTIALQETLYPDRDNSWQFVFGFKSRHAGYGDRTGQMLAQVITPHEAVITYEQGRVTSAVLDGKWNMIDQKLIDDTEIKLAPVHEVDILVMESYPEQIGVYIKGGLADGCTSFHDAVVTRDGYTIDIEVTVQRPLGVACPAVYTYFEKNLNLGSDFERGATYTLHVNDYTTTFTYPE